MVRSPDSVLMSIDISSMPYLWILPLVVTAKSLSNCPLVVLKLQTKQGDGQHNIATRRVALDAVWHLASAYITIAAHCAGNNICYFSAKAKFATHTTVSVVAIVTVDTCFTCRRVCQSNIFDSIAYIWCGLCDGGLLCLW